MNNAKYRFDSLVLISSLFVLFTANSNLAIAVVDAENVESREVERNEGIASSEDQPTKESDQWVMNSERDLSPEQTRENLFKVVFLKGIPESCLAPGLESANWQARDTAKALSPLNELFLTIFKIAPECMEESTAAAKELLKEAVKAPAQIWMKECSETFHQNLERTYREAKSKDSLVDQRLTWVKGCAAACVEVAFKAGVKAPLAGICYAGAGGLLVPATTALLIAGGSLSAVDLALYNGIGGCWIAGKWVAAVVPSAIAAGAVGIADLVVPKMQDAE